MKVYHASSIVVDIPNTSHSREHLDFGKGFYVTTLEHQAVEYGQRFLRRGRKAWLNVYDLSEEFGDLKVIRFDAYDEAWLDFITECRAGRMFGDYDIVCGGIANDKVFRTIDLYFSGDLNKQDALRRLMYEKPNNQLCFRTDVAIKRCLHFLNAVEL